MHAHLYIFLGIDKDIFYLTAFINFKLPSVPYYLCETYLKTKNVSRQSILAISNMD
jgi:hypothetical protein